MENIIKEALFEKLKKLNLVVDSVSVTIEDNKKRLKICLDSEDVIDLEKIVIASKEINPIIDELDLIQEEYILEVYGKSKGDADYEC